MKVSLVVAQGKPAGKEIPLLGSQFLIGRDQRCNLRPNSDLVSKLHCAFELVDQAVTVRDLGSTNGTFVNGKRVEGRVTLKDGDLVKVGPLVFAAKVVLEKPAAAAAPGQEEDALGWLMAGSDGKVEEPSEVTTVMEMNLPDPSDAEETVSDQPMSRPQQGVPSPAPAEAPKKDTREAASDILNRYLVRRRPS